MILASILTIFMTTSAFAAEKPQSTAPIQEDEFIAPKAEPIKPIKRDLIDLQYLPEEGQFFGSFVYGQSRNTSTLNNDRNGDEYYSAKASSETYKLLVGYGISDAVAFAFSISQAPLATREYTYGPASGKNNTDSLNSDGMTDPEVQIKYRAQNQENFAGNLDIGISFSPGLAESTSATTNTRGNVARGGAELGVDIQFGRKYQTYGYSFDLSYVGYGESSSTNPDTKQIATTSNSSEIAISAQGQLRPLERLAIDGALTRTFHSSQSTTSTSAYYMNADAYASTTLTVAASVIVVSDHLAARIGYSHDFETKITGLAGSTPMSETARANRLALGLIGAF